MNNNFNWDLFKSEVIAINCDTKDKALDFLMECESQGLKWGSGCKPTKYNYWDLSKEETTYSIQFGGIVASNIECDESDGLKIVKWEI